LLRSSFFAIPHSFLPLPAEELVLFSVLPFRGLAPAGHPLLPFSAPPPSRRVGISSDRETTRALQLLPPAPSPTKSVDLFFSPIVVSLRSRDSFRSYYGFPPFSYFSYHPVFLVSHFLPFSVPHSFSFQNRARNSFASRGSGVRCFRPVTVTSYALPSKPPRHAPAPRG